MTYEFHGTPVMGVSYQRIAGDEHEMAKVRFKNGRRQFALKVLICAGGTGGGIYPGLAAADALAQLGVSRERILWIGTKGEMEETLVPKAGLRLETVKGGPIVGVPPLEMMKNGIKLGLGCVDAVKLLRRHEPDVVFMTGGYVAAPVAVAAKLLGVPVVIYLPDVEPGSAIKLVMGVAQKVACTTDGSRDFVPAEKLVVTGYPVRPELHAATRMSKEEALSRFDLRPERQTVFVFGGSRGARSINRALTAHLPELLARAQVIHISGKLDWDAVSATAQSLADEEREYYRAFPYLHEEMGAAFRAADLVVARAGASMLGECPAFGLPSILIPYPYAWRYQKVNADFLSDRGAGQHLADDQLIAKMVPTVLKLLGDAKKMAEMRSAALALDIPDAAENLAQLIVSVGKNAAQEVTA